MFTALKMCDLLVLTESGTSPMTMGSNLNDVHASLSRGARSILSHFRLPDPAMIVVSTTSHFVASIINVLVDL